MISGGFSTSVFEVLYPRLWDGCIFALCPELGIQGSNLYNYAADNYGGGMALKNAPTWVLDNNLYAINLSTNQYLSGVPRLQGTSVLTISWWMSTTFDNNDELFFETSPNYNSNSTAIVIDPNASQSPYTGTFLFGISAGSNSAYKLYSFARPSSGVMHHYAVTFDNTSTTLAKGAAYVDGVPQTLTTSVPGTGFSGGLSDYGSFFGSRNGANLFLNAHIGDIRFYNRYLLPGEAQLLASQRGVAYLIGDDGGFAQSTLFRRSLASRIGSRMGVSA